MPTAERISCTASIGDSADSLMALMDISGEVDYQR